MTDTIPKAVEPLFNSLEGLIRKSNQKLPNEYFYSSLSFCLTDSIFSMGVRYQGVQNTIKNLSSLLKIPIIKEEGVEEYPLQDFYIILDSVPENELAEIIFKNKQRTSSRNGITKALAVKHACQTLLNFSINKFQDFTNEKAKKVERQFLAIKGQNSGISYKYFRMLAGSEDTIKPDRMVCRYISEAMNSEKYMDPLRAEEKFFQAYLYLSEKYPTLTPRFIDYLIWQHQRSS